MLNADAPLNMLRMSVTLETSQFETSAVKDFAPLNISRIVFTFETFHFAILLLNDVAPLNIPAILVTLDTSHLEMSALNDFAPLNKLLMSVTRDTSHDPIDFPSGPLQPPSGDCLRHVSTADLSSLEDFGWNTVMESVGCWFSVKSVTILSWMGVVF